MARLDTRVTEPKSLELGNSSSNFLGDTPPFLSPLSSPGRPPPPALPPQPRSHGCCTFSPHKLPGAKCWFLLQAGDSSESSSAKIQGYKLNRV